jgi:hypothetical protein
LQSQIIAVAALFSAGWSERGGLSPSVESAQARARLHVYRLYQPFDPYRADTSGLSWYAVRAYYAGGPWCPTTTVGFTGYGYGYGYGTAGDLNNYTCYSGWDDYAKRFGISCTPGTPVKGLAHPFLGGDGILYACQ